jgi:Zn-dependent peptidase ImmA (M78 family)
VRRGFKSCAEQIATEIRGELGLSENSRLNTSILAEHLAIPVFTIRQVAGCDPQNSFAHFFSVIDPDSFSAVTVFCGYKRFIVHNENHHPHRQSSNLAHEISHSLLEHEPTPVADSDGKRFWNTEVEQEATWLGASLLVPRSGALEMIKSQLTIAKIASHFGVSESLCEWRVRQSGVDKQAERWRRYRRS